MFDQSHLSEILTKYKQDFATGWWEKEKYKWEAVKHFQDNWIVSASDFTAMIDLSFAKTYNLLASSNYFPLAMIKEFSEAAPEEVRAAFIDLFDENKDLVSRVLKFKDWVANFHKKYKEGIGQHYQYENAISTYLWLRYPDKYYIYKYGMEKRAAEILGSSYQFVSGAYSDNIRNHFALYNEICATLKQDSELVDLLQQNLTSDCYPDPELKTLTIDVVFYITQEYSKPKEASKEEWIPVGYSPNISVEQWLKLLSDPEVFTVNSLKVMKRMKDYGGQATCTQLANEYGEVAGFYIGNSTQLAKRVLKKTGIPFVQNGKLRYWPVLYVGQNAGKDDEGVFIWKLRDELAAALDKFDLSKVELYKKEDASKEETGYWWLNANPKIWSLRELAIGEVSSYSLYNENGHKRHIFQNFLDAKAGDPIIGYETSPVKKIVALAKVSTDQDGKKFYFEKTEGLSSPIDYETIQASPELAQMEFMKNPQGSLLKLTKEEYEFIIDLIRDSNPTSTANNIEKYNRTNFLDEVFMTEARYDALVSVLQNKLNIILQGAPGSGKTFAAKRLAFSMMGEKDESRLEFVQFHQNYSYEDFMMGYKPVGDGFELQYGIFYNFCQKAANNPDKDYFFIIDEINRGNLSKIFGELLMLIEKDYRNTKARLVYNGLLFAVPDNIYIIGMMNTADRSLAMIDYALRRRFSFFDMEPGFDSEGFTKYQKNLNNSIFDAMMGQIKELNKEITSDQSLGRGFCIGHSYFCGQGNYTDDWLRSVIDYDILPLLAEYWFDDRNKLQRWENNLRGVFQ